jgi:rSAM/selenodomain-associated transferase 2
MKRQVSIVIPVLNGAAHLADCLQALAAGSDLIREIIAVDGGSTDASAAIAQAAGAIVLHAPAGRGGQLRAGIAAATGGYLLLLHADTVLAPGWVMAVAGFNAPGKAGYFRFRLASGRRAARVIEWIVAQRCRFLALPYGDQGLLISADLLQRVGGVPDLPLMEDVALVRRLGAKRLTALHADAVTSAARYERDGFLRRPLRNVFCLMLYFADVPLKIIQKLYG